MEELIEIVGSDTANLFMTAFGGQCISFPANMYPSHKIALVVGFDAALKLSKRWSKITVTVPRGSALKRQDRNLRIRADRQQGATINHLAFKYQLTSRQVSTILKKTIVRINNYETSTQLAETQ